MEWCRQGEKTYQNRLDLFLKQKEEVENQIALLKKTEAMIDYKIWYYTQALQDGNEEQALAKTASQDMPNDVLEAYRLSHESKE